MLIPTVSYAGLKKSSINVDGLKRSFYVYLPSYWNKGDKFPLMLALHPGGTNSKTMIKYTGMNVLAERDSFIVVYPEAFQKYWNDGRDFEGIKSQKLQIDDVGFISELLYHFSSEFNIDEKRIFVTGASSGAMMCYKLACQLSNRIAAIAPVIASFPENLIQVCVPKNPIPAVIILSQNDPVVPWKGGEVTYSRRKLGRCISSEGTVRFFLTLNDCEEKPEVEKTTKTADTGKSTLIKEIYYCNTQKPVIFYTIKGSGHGWPGGKPYLPQRIAGIPPKDFNASEVIWEFFKNLPL